MAGNECQCCSPYKEALRGHDVKVNIQVSVKTPQDTGDAETIGYLLRQRTGTKEVETT